VSGDSTVNIILVLLLFIIIIIINNYCFSYFCGQVLQACGIRLPSAYVTALAYDTLAAIDCDIQRWQVKLSE